MKTSLKPFLFCVFAAALFAGCTTRSESRLTSPKQPGTAVGGAVGDVAGTVTGNVVGAGVAAVESTVKTVQAPFSNERRVIRKWQTEKTADGRTIQVQVEIEVDAQGRQIGEARPVK